VKPNSLNVHFAPIVEFVGVWLSRHARLQHSMLDMGNGARGASGLGPS
jgi:hypothetical protein